MNEVQTFLAEVASNIEGLKADRDLQALSRMWARAVGRYRYAYNFSWMGRPIIQVPQDVMAMQELIWKVKPHVIVETGVAHGGSVLFYASMLELLGGDREVIGIDVDIRTHNRREIDAHPMSRRLHLIEGSSVDPTVIESVVRRAAGRGPVMVILDSNHTHDHVLRELRGYSPLVNAGSYLVVFDTLIEQLPDEFSEGRPWKKGNNPQTAVNAFLRENHRFIPDEEIDAKLLISVAPGGYLRCLEDTR